MLIFLFLYLCIPWKVTTPELYFSFYNCHLNILSGLLFIVGSLFTLLFIFMINTYIVFTKIFHFISTFIIGMMYEVFKYSDIFFYAILFKIYFFTNMSKCIELSFLFPLGFIFTYLTFIKSLLRNSIFRYLFLIENIFAIITGIIPFLLIIYTYQYKLLSLLIIVYGVLHIFILKKVRKQIYIYNCLY